MVDNPVEVSHKHQIRRGDRLFEPINHALITISSIAHAASLIVGGRTHKTAQPVFRTATRWPDLGFAIPLRGPLELALKNQKPDLIEIGVLTDPKKIEEPLKNPIVAQTTGFELVLSYTMAPLFIMYFERYSVWLKAKYGQGHNWPSVLDFARVVRNAAAHGGIDFRNPGVRDVKWRGLTYGYKDKGRPIIGTDLHIGEMLALMFDSNEALDALKAPVL